METLTNTEPTLLLNIVQGNKKEIKSRHYEHASKSDARQGRYCLQQQHKHKQTQVSIKICEERECGIFMQFHISVAVI